MLNSMPNKKISSETGLKKSMIKKEVFEREIAMCKKLSKENNGGCKWGKCKDCGAPLLLWKLYKGELIEDEDEIKKIKRDVLGV